MNPSTGLPRIILGVSILGALSVLASGCDQLEARQEIRKANRLHYDGRYARAAERYDKALALVPDLAAGHHNAAINYYKLFVPGDESKDNLEIGKKAAKHFQAYLAKEPDDSKIIGFLSNIWVDSGQYKEALAYWEKVLEKDPKNLTVLLKLADINRQAGRHADALKWLYRRVDSEREKEGKVQAYLDIAKLAWSRLNNSEIVDLERVAIADEGLSALRKAAELDPENADVQGYLGSLYQLRSLGHGAAWARYLDAASQRHHQLKRNEVVEAMKKKGKGAAAKEKPAKTSGDEE